MISRRTITEINDRTDIVGLVSAWVQLTPRGRTAVGRCPLCHQKPGKTLTFHVSADRKWFHCFSCKSRGGPIDFLMKLKGCSYPAAARALGERVGVDVIETIPE